MKTKLLICIIGGSGSGKSTLADEIIIHDGFSKVVSTTTRPRREGEHDGREYHFVDVETFKQMEKDDQFIETVYFSGNYYGMSKSEFFKNEDTLVFTIEPNGYMNVVKYIENHKLNMSVLVIFMDIPEKERFKNMVKRGDNPFVIQERLRTETIITDFKSYEITPDIRVVKLRPNIAVSIIESIKTKLLQ